MSDHREAIAEVLAGHRVNYHHRNVGGDTASELRYTSCDGCDWLGYWHDEAGWEVHLADALLGSDVLAQIRAEARAEALREAADEIDAAELHDWLNPTRGAAVWLRARAGGSA